MPTVDQAPINPNDNYNPNSGHRRLNRKAFNDVNQHYISNRAVLPDRDSQEYFKDMFNRNASVGGAQKSIGNRTPYKDQYSAISIKPNALSVM